MDEKVQSEDREDLNFLQKELTLFYDIYNELKGSMYSLIDLFIYNLSFRKNSQKNEH